MACVLVCVLGEISIWESWLKKVDIEGRRVRDLGLSFMLCSTVVG